MKYKCIRSYCSGEYLTKNKIYECIDGNFKYDDGWKSRTFSMNSKLGGAEMNYYLEEIKEDNNMKREFKVGDKVRIRQWDDMVKEFGINGRIIKVKKSFTTLMRPLCGEECVITDMKDDEIKLKFKNEGKRIYNWGFSTDMIEHINQPTSKTLTITTSDTTTTLTDGTHTTTINRYHTDKHDEQIAVNSVIDKYYDELKQIEIEKNKPKVGDMVRVVDRGCLFSRNHIWLEKNNVPLKTAIKWKWGNTNIDDKGYKVVCIHTHNDIFGDNRTLVLIEDDHDAFIIGVEGLEVVR